LEQNLGKAFFPVHVWPDHWILIVLDKTVKQVIVFDPIRVTNQYHTKLVLNLVKEMEGSTAEWTIVPYVDNTEIQRQCDAINCGYFTCWYARQLVTNQSINPVF
jgi:Ulp1 family protease